MKSHIEQKICKFNSSSWVFIMENMEKRTNDDVRTPLSPGEDNECAFYTDMDVSHDLLLCNKNNQKYQKRINPLRELKI